MSNGFATEQMRNDYERSRKAREEKYNLCSEQPLSAEQVAEYRKKWGLPPMPVYTRAPDNGQRNRKSDKPAEKVSDPVNQPAKLKHGHYFKDVSQLTTVDVYRVCALFGVNDPSGATHHAIKKLLLPGQRGAGKDAVKDLQEAVDTLNRRLEMLKEDANA